MKRLIATTVLGFATLGTAFADTAGIDADSYWKRPEVVQSARDTVAQAQVQQNTATYNSGDYSR